MLNIAPGLKGTGIEDVLSGKEVVRLIREWFESNRKCSDNGEEL